MDLPVRILSIGDDEHLLLSRELILRKQGYEVASYASNDFLKRGPSGIFDVAVISQSVTTLRAANVVEFLRRQHPETRILRIHPTREHAEKYYDLDCESGTTPSAFLSAVKTLCERTRVVTQIKQAAAVLPA
jgi:hypothetical protein